MCLRGKRARINELQRLLKGDGSDEEHEIEAMINYLETDDKNDTGLLVASSTIVKTEDQKHEIAEFDGIVIYPNRKQEQIVLLEAKNVENKAAGARNQIKKKLNKLGIAYNPETIIRFNKDAYIKMTIE